MAGRIETESVAELARNTQYIHISYIIHITNEIDRLDCLRLRFIGYASRWRLQTCEPGAIVFLT